MDALFVICNNDELLTADDGSVKYDEYDTTTITT